jgi:hypothetical protein
MSLAKTQKILSARFLKVIPIELCGASAKKVNSYVNK